MNEDTIKALEEQIKQEQQALALKASTLKAMKKDSRKYFGQGSFSRGYLGTIKVLSSPFANLYSDSMNKLDSPVDYAAEILLKNAAKFLEKTKSIKTPECKGAKRTCRKAVTHIIKLEEVLSNQNLHNSFHSLLSSTIATLKLKVESIRPPQTTEDIAKKERMRNMINEEAEKVFQAMKEQAQENNDDGDSSKSCDSNDSGVVVDIQQATKQDQTIHSEAQPAK